MHEILPLTYYMWNRFPPGIDKCAIEMVPYAYSLSA